MTAQTAQAAFDRTAVGERQRFEAADGDLLLVLQIAGRQLQFTEALHQCANGSFSIDRGQRCAQTEVNTIAKR